MNNSRQLDWTLVTEDTHYRWKWKCVCEWERVRERESWKEVEGRGLRQLWKHMSLLLAALCEKDPTRRNGNVLVRFWKRVWAENYPQCSGTHMESCQALLAYLTQPLSWAMMERTTTVSCFFFSSSLLLASFLELTRRDGGSLFDVADMHFLILLEKYIPKKGEKTAKKKQKNVQGTSHYWPGKPQICSTATSWRSKWKGGLGGTGWEPKEASGDQAGSKADLISTSGVSDVGSTGEKCGGLRWSPYWMRDGGLKVIRFIASAASRGSGNDETSRLQVPPLISLAGPLWQASCLTIATMDKEAKQIGMNIFIEGLRNAIQLTISDLQTD